MNTNMETKVRTSHCHVLCFHRRCFHRRVLTMEWVTGVKLTTLPAEEVRSLVGVGQEAFLVQLLEVGFFHGDPHPGNLLKVRYLQEK